MSVGPGCHSLGFGDRLGFDSRDGRICGFGGDALVTPGGAGGRCTIVAVSKLDAQELAELVPPRGTPVPVETTVQYPDEETVLEDAPD